MKVTMTMEELLSITQSKLEKIPASEYDTEECRYLFNVLTVLKECMDDKTKWAEDTLETLKRNMQTLIDWIEEQKK